MAIKYTDDSEFPFGKYKGIKFKNVPVEYFHWLWHNTTPSRTEMMDVHNYIHTNLSALKSENDDLLWSKK